MALKTDVPANLEIWTGGPCGLRLRQHPRLEEALAYLDEYPMVIRKPEVIDASSLPRSAQPKLNLGTVPVFVRSSVGEAVQLRLELDIPALPVKRPVQFARVFVRTVETVLEEHLVVTPGKRQVLFLPFPAYDKRTTFTVSMELRQVDDGKVEQQFELEPEKRLTFYYAFQTHLDLGWTDRVSTVVASLKAMTRQTAIEVIDQFRDRPEGERFIWTCECSDALRLAWEDASADEQAVLQQYVRDGLIQSCALPYSFHTNLMSRDLLQRALRRSLQLRREMDVEDALDLSVAQSNDVPGHCWILPDVLAESGIRRAVIGHNHMVRGCDLPPLFNWRGPDGGTVVTLASSCVDYGARLPVPQAPADLHALSVNNPEANPLLGTAYWRSIGYGENCGPEHARREIEAVAEWNAGYAWPRLVIGSPKDYFEHLETEVETDALPVVDREISDWWIDGPASTPIATANYRKAMIQLPKLQIPEDDEARAQRAEVEEALILHAEHTFGMNAQLVKVNAAAQDWRLDGLENYLASWEDKDLYAAHARAVMTELTKRYPLPRPLADPQSRNWAIDWDDRGISRLVDPEGATWYDREQAGDAPPFGSLVQRLLETELDEWFHHNPPAAPHAGDRTMTLQSVQALDHGVRLNGNLETPAGAIPAVTIDLVNDTETEDVLIQATLVDKAATAQAELLALALPFTVAQPRFLVDGGERLMRVDDDQLPDANRDKHSCITGWVMQAPAASLAVSSAEVFLWHFGALHYCTWNRGVTPRSSSVFAHLYNNVWNTNFRCWLEGDLGMTIRLRRSDKNHLDALGDMAARWA